MDLRDSLTPQEEGQELSSYQVPAIIYEGEITTRAGTFGGSPGDAGVDPSDLFGTSD
jgi:hypothetical protein